MIAPDRVWVVMNSYGFPRTVNDAAVDAKSDEDALNQFNRSPRFDGPYTTHEYRLHRPIPWRTGVPDAGARRRCGGLFALLLNDGSTLRECYLRPDRKWRWNGANTGSRIINPSAVEVQWCPEDEMPEGETT